MKRSLVFGTFDGIHPGHRFFLKKAKKHGRWLIASVARDGFVKSVKNRNPVYSEQERITCLLETGLVNEAYLADEVPGTYSTLLRAKPDCICLGHDQDALKTNLIEWMAKSGFQANIYTIPAYQPERYKSSKITIR